MSVPTGVAVDPSKSRSKKGLVFKSTFYDEFKMTKKAAELGLVEAQHNLGVMYLTGYPKAEDSKERHVDEVKALSW